MKSTNGNKSFPIDGASSSKNSLGRRRPGDENRPSATSRKSIDEDLRQSLIRQVFDVYVFERQCYEAVMVQYGILPRVNSKANYHDPAALHETENPEQAKRKNPWHTLVSRLFALKIDPIHYIRQIFSSLYARYENPPTPNQLLSSRYLHLYQEVCQTEAEDIALALKIQRQIATTEIASLQLAGGQTMEDATAAVLLNDRLALSSLFRYCLAVSMCSPHFDKIADEYKVGAAMQYIRAPENYDRHWNDFIPASFSIEAKNIYDGVQRLFS